VNAGLRGDDGGFDGRLDAAPALLVFFTGEYLVCDLGEGVQTL